MVDGFYESIEVKCVSIFFELEAQPDCNGSVDPSEAFYLAIVWQQNDPLGKHRKHGKHEK